jgi:hypothetical protein
MEIVVNGRPLPEHPARGTTYVEAIRNAEYSVRLTNHTAERVAVALAVDGLNSIDARTTCAARASKWVLGPYESLTITGWQISSESARRFFFTTEASSYATWLGRTENLGVIEAAVFRERRPRPILRHQKHLPETEADGESQRAPKSQLVPDVGDDHAATGIGRHVDNQVYRVRMALEPSPAAVFRVRYEYRPQLVRLGVLPDCEDTPGLVRRERAQGFTDTGFAPDPYRQR